MACHLCNPNTTSHLDVTVVQMRILLLKVTSTIFNYIAQVATSVLMAALCFFRIFSKVRTTQKQTTSPITQTCLRYTLYHYLFPLKQRNAILLSCDQYFHVSIQLQKRKAPLQNSIHLIMKEIFFLKLPPVFFLNHTEEQFQRESF